MTSLDRVSNNLLFNSHAAGIGNLNDANLLFEVDRIKAFATIFQYFNFENEPL